MTLITQEQVESIKKQDILSACTKRTEVRQAVLSLVNESEEKRLDRNIDIIEDDLYKGKKGDKFNFIHKDDKYKGMTPDEIRADFINAGALEMCHKIIERVGLKTVALKLREKLNVDVLQDLGVVK